MIPDAALSRTPRVIVLHAITDKRFYRSIVHPHGKIHRQFPFRHAQNRAEVFFQPHELGGEVKLLLRNFIRGSFFERKHISIYSLPLIFQASLPAPRRDLPVRESLSSIAQRESSRRLPCPTNTTALLLRLHQSLFARQLQSARGHSAASFLFRQ